jgi:hypothetical protein
MLKCMLSRLTRFGDADTDSTSLKGRSRKIKSLLQTVNSLKFNVTKTLRALCQLVLHNTDVRDTALGEELRDIIGSRIKREVSDMGRIRGLGGQGEWLSQRIAAVFSPNSQYICSLNASTEHARKIVPLKPPLPPNPADEAGGGRRSNPKPDEEGAVRC